MFSKRLQFAAESNNRKQLRKHLNKHHRDAPALSEVEETDIETLSSKYVLPSIINEIEVLEAFQAESSLPVAFLPSDLIRFSPLKDKTGPR